jgi:lysophospholipase L1-like esterase
MTSAAQVAMTSASSRARGGLFKAAVLLGSVIVALLLLEGAVRVRQYLKYGSAHPDLYTTTIDPATGLPIPAPGQRTPRIQINSLGFRGPELTVPKPPGTIRLAFLGASTTFCAEASTNEATWPHLVWDSFQKKWAGVKFDYLNAGVPGYGLEHCLRTLQHRIRPLNPDLIVIYEAVNELSRDTRELAKQQGITRGRVDEAGTLGKFLLTWLLIQKNLDIIRRQRGAAEGQQQLTFNERELSRGFENRLRTLIIAAKEVAPIVSVATFSQKVRRDQTVAEQLRASNTHLYYMPYMTPANLLRAFEEYNRVIRQVAIETGAILVEGEETIPGADQYFNDSVHFRDAGCRLMARRFEKTLLQSTLVSALVNERARPEERSSRLHVENGAINKVNDW